MTESRTWFDRFMAAAPPARALESFTPAPRALDTDLFVFDRRLGQARAAVFLGFRMTVARLPSGRLWVHAPTPLDPKTRADLDALGPVGHLVVPNSFHYGSAQTYVDAYPEATLWIAPGLAERRPEVPKGTQLEAGLHFEDAFDVRTLGPIRGLSEVAFVHRASRTLILTDLAKHITADTEMHAPGAGWVARLQRRAVLASMGTRHGFGPDRNSRLAFLRHDSARTSEALEEIARLDFDRIVVNHGDVLETGGHAEFRRAFAPHLLRSSP